MRQDQVSCRQRIARMRNNTSPIGLPFDMIDTLTSLIEYAEEQAESRFMNKSLRHLTHCEAEQVG